MGATQATRVRPWEQRMAAQRTDSLGLLWGLQNVVALFAEGLRVNVLDRK